MRVSWAKSARYGRRDYCCGHSSSTGTIWLVQQQIDESVLQVRQACVKRFIRRRLNKSDDKKSAVSGGAQRPQGNIIRSGKSWQASGDLLAEIADIHDMAISRMLIRCMPQLKTRTALLFSTRTKENPAYLYSAHSERKVSQHCGGCKDQGVRSLALSPDESCFMRLHLKRMRYRSLTWRRGDYSVDYHRRTS